MKRKTELGGETLERFMGLLGERKMNQPNENLSPNELVESLLDFWDKYNVFVKKNIEGGVISLGVLHSPCVSLSPLTSETVLKVFLFLIPSC